MHFDTQLLWTCVQVFACAEIAEPTRTKSSNVVTMQIWLMIMVRREFSTPRHLMDCPSGQEPHPTTLLNGRCPVHRSKNRQSMSARVRSGRDAFKFRCPLYPQ